MRALRFAAPGGWPDTFKRTGAAIYAGDSFGRAASLAYYFFLALFPGLLFVVSLASLFPVQHLIDRIVAIAEPGGAGRRRGDRTPAIRTNHEAAAHGYADRQHGRGTLDHVRCSKHPVTVTFFPPLISTLVLVVVCVSCVCPASPAVHEATATPEATAVIRVVVKCVLLRRGRRSRMVNGLVRSTPARSSLWAIAVLCAVSLGTTRAARYEEASGQCLSAHRDRWRLCESRCRSVATGDRTPAARSMSRLRMRCSTNRSS
jgi:hypothetical protein